MNFVKRHKITFNILAFIILITLLISLTHRSSSLILKVVIDGQLQEYKIDGVVDTGRQYKVGQKYKVTHHFILNQMVKREIELVGVYK